MNIFERIIEDKKRFSIVKKIFYVSLVVFALLELVVKALHLAHTHFPLEDIPAFGSIFGFVTCVVLILFAKFIGHIWLMKKEDYYD